MSGDQGKIKEIVDLRKNEGYDFRLLVDDAHGFGTLGKTGQGAGEAQGIHRGSRLLQENVADAFQELGLGKILAFGKHLLEVADAVVDRFFGSRPHTFLVVVVSEKKRDFTSELGWTIRGTIFRNFSQQLRLSRNLGGDVVEPLTGGLEITMLRTCLNDSIEIVQ